MLAFIILDGQSAIIGKVVLLFACSYLCLPSLGYEPAVASMTTDKLSFHLYGMMSFIFIFIWVVTFFFSKSEYNKECGTPI